MADRPNILILYNKEQSKPLVDATNYIEDYLHIPRPYKTVNVPLTPIKDDIENLFMEITKYDKVMAVTSKNHYETRAIYVLGNIATLIGCTLYHY